MPLGTAAVRQRLGLTEAKTVLSSFQIWAFFKTLWIDPFEMEALIFGSLQSLGQSQWEKL